MDPPETPAPVFAMRAFKSAIFGTPAGEENDYDDATKRDETPLVRKRNTIHPIETATNQQQSKANASSDTANQLSASPTKSILVTPGTISNRRKTVSFGETAFHEDSERGQALSRSNSSAPSSAGSVTSQWMSSQSDGKPRPRSRLTQSLIDAKELHIPEIPRVSGPARSEVFSTKDMLNSINNAVGSEDRDETVDLDEPHSQSGQYWKSEFENYRKRTNYEIRRLIEYRAAAKSYARKKDAEALRLTEKLRKEEEKVAEMERRVTGLASDMMSKDVDVDRESLVQELTKQTALTLQYQHKADTLRKTLERHGVVGSPDEQADSEGSSRDDRAEISRLQQALDQANKKLEERSQDDELAKLRNLAKSSENKASELEKENSLLKQTIARVKGEMGKYEERRSEKEAKLKHRAAKYETRCQEYKEKMREYRVAVHEERKMYSQQIQALKDEASSFNISNKRVSVNNVQRSIEEAGVQVHDFGDIPVDNNEEMLEVGDLP
jgi:Cut12 conserved domain